MNEPGNSAKRAAAPMPPGHFAEAFAKVSYRQPFRRYQALALEAFEKARAEGRRRTYLVLPPGAGKTVLGLEIARRLGNHTLALGPNTAIQAQWLAQWQDFQPPLVRSGADQELTTPLTALTYQAICNLDSHNPLIDEQAIAAWREGQLADGSLPPDHRDAASIHDRADLARLRQKARATVGQDSDHEQLLNLLHPNGRALIERIKVSGQWTILLDECHHLLEMWGYLLRALAQELGDNVFLVGLTATPPSGMEAKEAALYQELFCGVDFEIPTPAVVKEGNLAPYQELVYLTQPLEHEAQYLKEEYIRFIELTTAIMASDFASVPFLEWLNQRAMDRKGSNGSQVSWSRFEQDEPALALAVLRFYVSNNTEIPSGARVREAHRQPLTADDWVALIGGYCMGVLRHSPKPADQQAWDRIHRGLLSLGYVLTRQGVRSYVSPVDRVLLLSASKATAALDILDAETSALGDRLRALILCDYETAGNELVAQLRGALDPQAGSAAQALRILQLDSRTAGLDPILVTGKTLACSRATATNLLKWLAEQAPDLRERLDTAELFTGAGNADLAWEDVVIVRPSTGGWEPRCYVPLVTRYFEEGRSRCLIGTRGLLGEGWDAESVNVLIDLTGAATSTSVHQMRGRSLRLDPTLPRKVADNWDVVCVAPDNPKGAADYARFVRKHRSYDALTAEGEVESGVSHVDSRLSPYGPPPASVFQTINSSLLAQVSRRDAVYDLWGIGKPYENRTTQTVRVRFGRAIGIPVQRLARSSRNTPPRFRARLFGVVGTALTTGLAFTMVGAEAAGIAIGTALAAAGGAWITRTASVYLRKFDSSDALEDFGAAVAEGLRNAGLISPSLGADSVRVVPQQDGFYRCYLSEASNDEARLFAESLDELFAPLDNPHYIVPRFIPGEPRTPLAALGIALRGAPERLPSHSVVYHAVPSALGANRKRVSAFEKAWNHHVSAGSALYFKDPRAQAVLEIQRGEDPFAVTTQMRTLWI
ncbi:MAG TPA: DEAD/DEAH box helicase family protein [Ktedonobacterales bacterium]|nr:DEAD/DEAH box helicase family protein [Ktedonobacterales bacterium]